MQRKRLIFIALIPLSMLILFLLATIHNPGSAASATEPVLLTLSPGEPPPMIVGGQPAESGEWPWQVALVDAYTSNALEGQFCGGALIDWEWVLTAAHCVQDESDGTVTYPSEIDIVVGRQHLSLSDGQRINVREVYPHPGFAQTGEEDIALLRLRQPANRSEKVQTISLVTQNDTALIAPGIIAVVTGWGEMENGYYPNALQEVAVPIVSNPICQEAYNDEGTTITDLMLCAGEDGKDSCYGDSGGPLVVPNVQNSGYLLAGVVSFGHSSGCGALGKYGVYTRVPEFIDWITSHVNLSPTPSPTPTLTPIPTPTPTQIPNMDFDVFIAMITK